MPLHPLVPDLPPLTKGAVGDPHPILSEHHALPDPWRPPKPVANPDPAKRDPSTSYPTPFYRVEAVRRALKDLEDTEVFKRWTNTLLAVVGGLFRLESIALDKDGGAFGKVLAAADGDRKQIVTCRFTLRGQERLVAISDPEVGFWPAARLSPEDWQTVDQEIHSVRGSALALLADLRQAMRAADAWTPIIPWMLGVDRIIGEAVGDGKAWATHGRGEGPFRLKVLRSGAPAIEDLYLPVWSEGWGLRIRTFVHMNFASDRGVVKVRDANNRDQYEVIVPGGPARRGKGVVTAVGTAPPSVDTARLNLEGPTGLFAALSTLFPGSAQAKVDPLDVNQRPWTHPDVVRVLVHSLGPAGMPADRVAGGAGGHYGNTSILACCLADADLPSPQALLNGDGFVQVGKPGTEAELYVDIAGGPQELRRMGQALWSIFIGDLSDGSAVLERAGERIEALAELDAAGVDEARLRVATLQRFARAWRLTMAKRETTGDQAALLRSAAWAWIQHVSGEPPFPNGPVGARVVSWSGLSLPVDVGV